MFLGIGCNVDSNNIPSAPSGTIVGEFPAEATSIELSGFEESASGLEAAVAIDGSTYGGYTDLSVDGDGKATISSLSGVAASTKVRIRVKETATTLVGTYKEITVTEKALAVGDSYEGGIIAYIFEDGDTGYVEGAVHGLIAATTDQNAGAGIAWATAAYDDVPVPRVATPATGTGIGTGSDNTDMIIAQHNASSVDLSLYAAGVARSYEGGGHTDWFLPSKDELNKLYDNRVAIGGFSDISYWSSSESSASYAWFQYFLNGIQNNFYRYNVFRVRAVRAF